MSKKNKNDRLDAANDGLIVERRVDKKNKKPAREKKDVPLIPSFDYTGKVRKIAARYGECVFFVSGRNGVRVLGALSKVCRVKNVGFSDEGVQFSVPSKHRGQIIAILDNLCYDYKIIKNKGAVPLFFNSLARLGFAVGLIAAVVGVGIFPQFVTRVSVSAADGAYVQHIDGALNAEIQSILSSHGVRVGRWLPDIDCAAIEKGLLALRGVSYASVQRHGTHVDVRIKQEQPDDFLVEVSGSKVVSRKVAVVTRIVVEGGTAVVDYGDVVREGDTLIDGYTLFGEDKIEVEAKGTVYGKVYHRKTVFFADKIKVRQVVSVKKITKLSMFGKTPKTPESPFEQYELESTVRDLGFLLPFKIFTYEFREIAETEYDNLYTKEEMCASVYSEIVSGFAEPLRVLGRYEEIREADGGKYVTVTVEAEERIS